MAPNFDRLLKVFWREQPDRVPFYEHLVDTIVMETIMGKPIPPPMRGMDPTAKRASKKAFLQYLVDFFKGLGYDYVPLEMGLKLFRMNTSVSTNIEPLGKTQRGWTDNERSTISSMEEFEDYEWPPIEDAIDYEMFEVAQEVLPPGMKLVGGVGGGVYEHTSQLLGLRQLSISLRKDPAFIRAMFDKVGSLIEGADKIVTEMDQLGALRMGDDMGYKTGTLISPNHLREYVLPWQKRVGEVAHSNGKPFVLHSCGNLSEIMEDLINDVQINAIHSFQDIIYPVTEAKERYGNRIAILGGVDVEILCNGTIPEVEDYTHNVLTKCMQGGGYALGSGNSITNYMNLDNYQAMLNIGKKFGSYL